MRVANQQATSRTHPTEDKKAVGAERRFVSQGAGCSHLDLVDYRVSTMPNLVPHPNRTCNNPSHAYCDSAPLRRGNVSLDGHYIACICTGISEDGASGVALTCVLGQAAG